MAKKIRAGQRAGKEIVRLENVVTKRGGFSLVIDQLEVRAGEIVCIVGPNGGGKTTLLMTLLGLLPHQGQCRIGGTVYDGTQTAVKASIGFVPDDPELLFAELTAAEQWGLTASVIHSARPDVSRSTLADRTAQLAKTLAFDPPPKTARQYSHGMRKKTQIVNALLGSPQLIVADELRNGLDPIVIKQAEELIRQERARGAAVVAATHDLWWAERFADYIYVLHQGKLVAAGRLPELLAKGEAHLEQAFFRIIGVEP